MRPLLALVISAVILGGLAVYTQVIRPRFQQHSVSSGPLQAAGTFSVEVLATFTADAAQSQADPFALRTGDEPERRPWVVSVRLSGRDEEVTAARIAQGQPLVLPLRNLVEGRNELALTAYPPADSDAPQAVRLVVLRDGVPVPDAEQTFWSHPGQPVRGTATFELFGNPLSENPVE